MCCGRAAIRRAGAGAPIISQRDGCREGTGAGDEWLPCVCPERGQLHCEQEGRSAEHDCCRYVPVFLTLAFVILIYLFSKRKTGFDDCHRCLPLQLNDYSHQRTRNPTHSHWRCVVCERRVSRKASAKKQCAECDFIDVCLV